MFEPGEKVVCVNADPVTADAMTGAPNTMNLVKGRIYTVEAFYPKGTVQTLCGPAGTVVVRMITPGVAIGVLDPYGWDIWMASRFRKIIRRDISESLALLKGLPKVTGPQKVDA
jgi:hypothetical protein